MFLPLELVRNFFRTFVNWSKLLVFNFRYPHLQKFLEQFKKIWLQFFWPNSENFLSERQSSELSNAVKARTFVGIKIRKNMFHLANY